MPARLTRSAPWLVALIAAAAGVLYVVAVREGAIHQYYSPAAAGMAFDWHNFIYGSVDTAGFAGLDKIPGALWPQALSVAAFGYSTWALLIPEVLATIATIVILYLAVARWIGRPAGLIAALIYACTPVVAAVAQVNVPETWFALPLTVAAYFSLRAVQSGRVWWLVGAGLAIAAAFQVKMLQAWLLWPAVIIVYLVAAPNPIRRRIWHLLVAGAISLVASLWWVILVWLTPAGDRPWVGGSDSNSPWEMVFGYNGLGRFGWWSGRSFVADMAEGYGFTRLVGSALAVDLGWLLPLAAIGLIAGLLLTWRRPRIDVTRAGWLLFGLWFVLTAATLMWASGIHTFYVLAYAPAMAAIVAGGFTIAIDQLRTPGSRRLWLIGVVLAVQAAWTSWLVVRSDRFLWLIAVTIVFTAVAGVALVWRRADVFIAAALIAALAAPATWTVSTLGATNPINPTAFNGGIGPGGPGGPGGPAGPGGPSPSGGPGGMPAGGPGGGAMTASTELIQWLRTHDNGSRYLIAGSSDAASGLVIAYVRGVMYLGGGFQASDPVPTADELSALIASGQLQYVLSGSGRPGPGGQGGQGGPGGPGGGQTANTAVSQARTTWISAHCTQMTDAPTGVMRCT